MSRSLLQFVALLCGFAQALVGLAPAGTMLCFHGGQPVGVHLNEHACSSDHSACGGHADDPEDRSNAAPCDDDDQDSENSGSPAEHPWHGHAVIPSSSARLDSQGDLSFAIAAASTFVVVCTDLPLVPLAAGSGRRAVAPDDGICHASRISTQKLLI